MGMFLSAALMFFFIYFISLILHIARLKEHFDTLPVQSFMMYFSDRIFCNSTPPCHAVSNQLFCKDIGLKFKQMRAGNIQDSRR